jgi:hypothetical protein
MIHRPPTSSVSQHLLRHKHHRNRLPTSENRRRNSGEPQRNWVSPDDLPSATLDYISAAIDNLGRGLHFCEYGWNLAYS